MPATVSKRPSTVVGLGLDLLHAHTIGADAFGPGLEALRGRRADAVQVQRDEAKHAAISGMTHPRPRHDDRARVRAVRGRGGVLRFGEFRTKAGRLSPYFFNSALFDDGAKLMRLGGILCAAPASPRASRFDMLFGPAYKGITLAAAVAIEFGAARPGGSVRLQPQGSKRSRRGRHSSSAHRCGAAPSSSMM